MTAMTEHNAPPTSGAGSRGLPRSMARGRATLPSSGRGPRTSWLSVAVVALALVVTLVPLGYLLSVSLMGRDETVSGILATTDPQWSNYTDVWSGSDIPRSILNSVIAAVVATVMTLAFSLPGAWAIVQFRTGGRTLANLVTSPWLLPPIVAVVPLFLLLTNLGLNDTLVGLILVYALVNVPVGVWLLEGFLRKLPEEIFEAAALDGAGPWRILWRMVVPLMVPALVAVGTIVTILNYNEFLLATYLTQSPESRTAPVTLSLFYGDRTPHFGKIAAASVMIVIPVFTVAAFMQRRMIAGLASGAGK